MTTKINTKRKYNIVYVTRETHARMKMVSSHTGIKLSALAEKYVSMGVMLDLRDNNIQGGQLK